MVRVNNVVVLTVCSSVSWNSVYYYNESYRHHADSEKSRLSLLSYCVDLIVYVEILSPIYTAENLWHGSDEKSTRTKKIVLITHLHVLFSTVLNYVKLTTPEIP